MVYYCWLSFDDCCLKFVNVILIYMYKFFLEDNQQYMFYVDFELDDMLVIILGYFFGILIWDYFQSKIEKIIFCVWLFENFFWI